jgi:hypothetical protein
MVIGLIYYPNVTESMSIAPPTVFRRLQSDQHSQISRAEGNEDSPPITTADYYYYNVDDSATFADPPNTIDNGMIFKLAKVKEQDMS